MSIQESREVPQAFKKLIKTVARCFYTQLPQTGKQPASGKGHPQKADQTGLCIVLLDLLVEQAWLPEDEIAKKLQLPLSKPLRTALQFLSKEQLLSHETITKSRKRSAAEVSAAGTAEKLATAEEEAEDAEREQKKPGREVSYFCIDYPGLVDAAQFRISKLLQGLKERIQDKAAVLQYKCPREDCQATYTTLQADQLINFATGMLHCEICKSVLDQDFGDNVVGNETLRKERNKAARALRVTAERQLAPILELVKACQKRTPCPDFGTLRSWAQAVQAARRPAAGPGTSPARQDVEARIEVNLEGLEPVSANQAYVRKEQPAWLRKSDNEPTAAATSSQQETSSVKLEAGASATAASASSPPATNHEEEFKKAWWAQYTAMQAQAAAALPTTSSPAYGGIKLDPNSADEPGSKRVKLEADVATVERSPSPQQAEPPGSNLKEEINVELAGDLQAASEATDANAEVQDDEDWEEAVPEASATIEDMEEDWENV
ncbi:hypothetical protein WJX74_004983 [Apatococcus lobatus]|uniref:Transcription initiation factor IIE subunit alpha N-terminal domain-containing protein n=2 Tax=Apatococcus TaxID=904362 RepID=A0AAW1RG58_9CHLO